MRVLPLLFVVFALHVWAGMNLLSGLAVSLWLWYLWDLFEDCNKRIAFKEFILCLYGLNYLFSPAISYLTDHTSYYRMKIPEDAYFLLAIPSMLLLQLGMNVVKTTIFEVDFTKVQVQSLLNQKVLISWLYGGSAIILLLGFVPAELGFFFGLLAGVRFVAAFGLFVMDRRRYKWHILGVLALESFVSLQQGMFHDLIMWIFFFGLFWIYLNKPGRNLKLLLGLVAIAAVYVLQITKSEYRSQLASGDEGAGLATFQEAVEKNVDADGGLFTSSKTTGTISRVNQAWILASTVWRMDYRQDFQGMDLMKIYAEAAFLPRILAPNKLKAGDRNIFNKFSGHYVSGSTSMGLGFFADGYIAYGATGTYGFAFLLGLLFSVIFKIVEYWSRISAFFILLIFPILIYVVRPDCETQTIMGYIVKGLFVYGMVMWYYERYFSRVISEADVDNRKIRAWKKLTSQRAESLHEG